MLKSTYNNKIFFTIMIFIILLYSVNTVIAPLCFCILFQIGSIVEIIKQVRVSKQVKRGKYATGNLTTVRKISGVENEVHNYEGIIAFHFPDNENKYLLKHRFSSIFKPNISKQYKIWINEKNPESSVVLDYFKWERKVSVFVLSLITIGLFIVEFILINKILHGAGMKPMF